MNADRPSTIEAATPPVLAFGGFQLVIAQRRLYEDGRPVRLGSRALELLIALVEQAGALVTQEALVARVWPREVVEHNTLRVHIAALRKALGDDRHQKRYIANEPGQGYRFVAPLQRLPDCAAAAPAPAGSGKLPALRVRMLGRQASCDVLVQQLQANRFVTIVGAGGMGKTTLALAVAERLAPACAHGAWFVDLSALAPEADVLETFATALEVAGPGALLPRLVDALRPRELLLLVDNCEHVLAPLAPLLESLLAACPRLSVLATSHEPLRAEGEWVHLLPALDFPRRTLASHEPAATDYPAVQLFVERAEAADDGFQLTPQRLAPVVEICRQLDGMPLAIELTAALLRDIPLTELAASLESQLLDMRRRQPAAVSRHQTLQAMLDWSHRLLLPVERTVLRRLAVFRGGMNLEGVLEVVGPIAADDAGGPVGGDQRCLVREALAGLVSKSWLTPDLDVEPVRWQMHGLARAYAAQKLVDAGEALVVGWRHAAHLGRALVRSREEWPHWRRSAWLERHAAQAIDARAAIGFLMDRPDGRAAAWRLFGDAWMLGFELRQFADLEGLAARLAAREAAADDGARPQLRLSRIVALLVAGRVADAGAAGDEDADEDERPLLDPAHPPAPHALPPALLASYVQAMYDGEFELALRHAQVADALATRLQDDGVRQVTDEMARRAGVRLAQLVRGRALRGPPPAGPVR